MRGLATAVVIGAWVLSSVTAHADDGASGAAATAAAAQPTVPAPRTGTLGIPSVAGAGVNALANNQVNFGQGEYNLQFLAQVGRLQLGHHISLDVLGETALLDVPVSARNPQVTSTSPPLPRLQLASFDSVGVRVRFDLSNQVPNDTQRLKDVSRCLTERHLPAGTVSAARIQHCTTLGVDMHAAPTNVNDIAAVTAALQKGLAGWSLVVGGRVMYVPVKSGTTPSSGTGGAVEAALQGIDTWGGGFLSVSGLGVGGSTTITGDTEVRQELVRELRFGGGLYWQFNAPTESVQLLPTLGVYATYVRNFWKNLFFAPGTDRYIGGDRIELVGYVSGHFSGGFAGLLSASLMKPYGPDYSNWQVIFGIAPLFGAPTSP